MFVGLGRLGFLGLVFVRCYCDTVSRFELLLLGLVHYFWVVCDLLPGAFGLLRVVWFRVFAWLLLVWMVIASHTHDFGCWRLTCFVWWFTVRFGGFEWFIVRFGGFGVVGFSGGLGVFVSGLASRAVLVLFCGGLAWVVVVCVLLIL